MSELGPMVPIEKIDYDRADKIFQLIESSIRQPNITDPVEWAFLLSLLPELMDGGLMRPHFEESLALLRQSGGVFRTGYALRTLEFAMDKQARYLVPEYPLGFDNPSAWKRVFVEMDPADFVWDMQVNLQSNMADAYGIYHLLSQVFQERWSDSPIVLDNGSSLGLGLKKWLLPGAGFQPIKVIKAPSRGQPIVPEEMEPDEEAQEAVNALMSQAPIVKTAVGYDASPIQTGDEHSKRDNDALNRVFSHTFPMSESLKRPEEVKEFWKLAFARADNIILPKKMIAADDRGSLDQISDYLPRKADMAIFSAIIFEQSTGMVNHVFDNVAEHSSDLALYFITDFMKTDKGSPHGVRFVRRDWWHRPGSFAAYVMDPNKPGRPAEEIARFASRRATEMWLTPAGRELILGRR